MELDRLTIKSSDELRKWLADKRPEWAQVIAVRAVLRVFPEIFQIIDVPDGRLNEQQQQDLILQIFRAAFISWAGRKYPTYKLEGATAAGTAAEEISSAAEKATVTTYVAARATATHGADARSAAATGAARAFGSVARSTANVNNAAKAVAVTTVRSVADIAYVAARASARSTAVARSAAVAGTSAVTALWRAVSCDCTVLMELGGNPPLINRPLWPEGGQGADWSTADAPGWVVEPLNAFEATKWVKTGPWGLMTDWYKALLPIEMGETPKSLFGEKADIAIATQPDEFWTIDENRSAEDVLREIAEIAGLFRHDGLADQNALAFRELIEEFLERCEKPATLDEIREHFSKFDRPPADTTIRGRLSDMARSGRIIRLKQALYVHPKWVNAEKSPLWDFFLSYNENDRATAERISDFLEDSGYAVFSQFNDMTAGKSFVGEMNRGLDGMGRLISIYSDDYFASGPCMSEWEAAYLFDPSGEKGKIVPFMVRSCSPPPLARRLVWTSLLGLSSEQEKRAVLNAIKDGDTPRDRVLQRRAWTQASSPDVALDSTGERLDAVPNKEFDDPYVDVDLADLPELLRSLIHTAMEALKEKNCSSGFVAALNAYKGELDARGASCIVSVLRGQMDFVEAELDDPESSHWLSGAGLKKTFENIRNAHVKLLAHYPLDQDRERLLRAIQLDRPKLEPDASRELREKIVHATEVAHDEDIVTDSYRTVVESRHRVTRDILELRTPEPLEDGDADHRMNEEERARRLNDAKKRALAQQAGFADKSLDTLNKMAKLADSPSAQRLAKALQDLADWFW